MYNFLHFRTLYITLYTSFYVPLLKNFRTRTMKKSFTSLHISYLCIFAFLNICVFALPIAAQTVPVILTAGQSNTDGRLNGETRPAYLMQANDLCLASAQSPYDEAQLGKFRPFFPASGEEFQPKRWAYDAVVYYKLTHDTTSPLINNGKKPFLYVIKTSYGGSSIDPQTKCSPSKIVKGATAWGKDYASGYHWSADPQFLASTDCAEKPYTIAGDTTTYIGQSMLKAWIANIDAGLDALKKEGKTPDIRCILWHQGESDRHVADRYHDNLKAMLAYVRQHLVEKTGDKRYFSLPFFCGTVPQSSKQYSKGVEDAQYQLQREDRDFHVIDLHDLTLQKDQLHFDAPSAEKFGALLYQALLDNNIFAPVTAQIAHWHGNADAALTYTFDDGLLEDYTVITPALKERGLVGTFCIIGSKVGKDQKGTPCCSWAQLKEMSRQGMEIASHGYNHINVQKLDSAGIVSEMRTNDDIIEKNIGKRPETFCFPGNRKSDLAIRLINSNYVGSRLFEESLGSKRDSLWMTNWLHDAIRQGSWIIGMTHGIRIGYDHFPTEEAVQTWFHHLDEAAQLQRDGKLWIATLADAIKYQKERDASEVTVKKTKKGYTVSVTCPLDKKTYNIPLTVILTLPDGKTITANVKPNSSVKM